MNEIKGGTPFKPYEPGQKVWNRVIEKVCTVKVVFRTTRRHPSGEGLVAFYTYMLDEDAGIWQHHQLAEKNPEAPMFKAGAERPSTSTPPIFTVCKILSSVERPYFIVETAMTSDGPRERICEGRWFTELQAADECTRRRERAHGKV
jgi:hypothetical protein